MSNRTEQQEKRVHALAGTLQAASLVSRLARTGLTPQDSFESSVGSLFIFDPGHVSEIYGGSRGLIHGFRILDELLQGSSFIVHGDAIRYALAVRSLAVAAQGNGTMMDQLRIGLQAIQHSSPPDNGQDAAMLTAIADLYQETIGNMGSRIQVTGDIRYLQNQNTADKIRALLLAAIRSAMLWHQVGGRLWQLVTSRRAMSDVTSHYLTLH